MNKKTLTEKILEKKVEIENKQNEIENKQEEIDNFEIDPDTAEESYCETIDETPVDVCGISFDASRILRELDPTAYNCGLSDFVASLDPMDVSEEYAELEDELEELNDELEELNEELEELNELEKEFE